MKKTNLIRATALALVLSVLVSITLVPSVATPIFEDVPDKYWAAEHINRAYKEGWVSGTLNTPERKLFSPTTTLTTAEWCAVVSNMAFPGEANTGTSTIADPGPVATPWYTAHVQVLLRRQILQKLDGYNITGSITREAVVQMIYYVAKNKLVYTPTANELAAAKAKIKDYDQLSKSYADAMVAAVAWGVISGDENGNVNPQGLLSRAEMATLACKMYDLIVNRPTIGSISEEPVTLSLATHHWVTDYWIQLSPEMQNTMDRDAFNCAAQTARDYWKIRFAGNPQPKSKGYGTVKNDQYNFACYTYDAKTTAITNVANAGSKIGLLNLGSVKEESGSYCDYFTINDWTYDSLVQTAEVKNIINDITKDMSDRDVVLYCIKAVVDKLDYQTGSVGATWLNGKTIGNCGNYSSMIKQLLCIAGIPNFTVTGTTKYGDHEWIQVRIDGKWYIVDGTMAETRNNYEAGILTFDTFNENWGGNTSTVNNSDILARFRTLASYIPARSEMYKYTDSYY